jgi:ubiquinone/menaquinone biosynthesis C-methylase UbiE
MNWEEAIIFLRTKPDYSDTLFHSYLNDDPVGNVERFGDSQEFKETLKLIKKFFPDTQKILEIGSGAGMAAAALSIAGYAVTATDPDPSDAVGCAAIQKLNEHYQLKDFSVVQCAGEHLPFESEAFDLVYIRQALHHSQNLNKLLKEIARVLKPGGGLIAVREHVIFNANDKQVFLDTHPLQKWYGGENAYTLEEYTGAIEGAHLISLLTYKYFDSVINYFPLTENEVNSLESGFKERLKVHCFGKFGALGKLRFIQFLYRKLNEFRFGTALDERRIPGRMYSFVARK